MGGGGPRPGRELTDTVTTTTQPHSLTATPRSACHTHKKATQKWQSAAAPQASPLPCVTPTAGCSSLGSAGWPPCPEPMEAAAAVARRAGLLARARPGSRPRVRAWERGVGSAPPAARRRLLVASLGVGEPLPVQSSRGEEAVALEVLEDDDEANSTVPAGNLPHPDADEIALVPGSKTVRVKFVLKKQCAFGQQFLVVGDAPALGQWDPSKATALDWSEDHVWTAKTDLPANKLIEFKFLLRDASGHVCWQHGANRTLETTETTNILVVYEDWDHAMKQKVSEEEELSAGPEDVMFSDDLAGINGATLAHIIADENLKNQSAAVLADAPLQVVANETNQPKLMLDKDQTVLEELRGEAKTVAQKGRNGDGTTLCQEGAQLANRPPSILENDLAWAGKAMHQVLRILGFQIGTTKT
ncbi:hypothetical protein GQ55_5G085600 [Panicum hallii var. hallii]|uniref:CBM20 domain-containing protein n=1 Tax=Panicum hallii var. hallii TaxID=1504633 RepID=A0A2T7DE83_9POAL|nr:hypothetical protein GQ55_5G085600 [Panicum hallii var. hallii]